MRYLVFLSLLALALYAATAEDVYEIYKNKGINAVEEYLKREFEPKEIKEVKVKEVKTKPVALKPPTEKELISRDFWM